MVISSFHAELINVAMAGGVDQLIQRRAKNRKVAKPWLTPNEVTRCCVLGKDTYSRFT